MTSAQRKPRVGLISLGCPKNLVDSEVMLGTLLKQGYELTKKESDADVMIVNTCAFIDESKKESVDTILDVAKRKKDGALQKLIVTGCLAQRYSKELEKEIPEVDHFIGTGEFHRIAEFTKLSSELPVAKSAVATPEFIYDYATPRISTLPKHTAYVKIAEGCSRTCAFCIIPKLRGDGRSRDIASIVRESEMLAENGTKEIHLLAQDLTAYGRDRKDGTTLDGLLERLEDIEGIEWVRLMYNYPKLFTKNLIHRIATSKKVCKYLDIPLQHIDSKLLAKMRRHVDERKVRELIKELRTEIPNLTLRTTLIVGFPGETEAQFQKLSDFVEETRFERLGVFTYSKEEGTPAATMPNQVPEKIKLKRRDQIMRIAQKTSKNRNARVVGTTVRVLVDRTLPTAGAFSHMGRTESQALDIDGNVYLTGRSLRVGEFVNAKILKTDAYDLFAEVA